MIPEDVGDSPSCQNTLPPKKYRFQKYIPPPKKNTHIVCGYRRGSLPQPRRLSAFLPFPFHPWSSGGAFYGFYSGSRPLTLIRSAGAVTERYAVTEVTER